MTQFIHVALAIVLTIHFNNVNFVLSKKLLSSAIRISNTEPSLASSFETQETYVDITQLLLTTFINK